MKKITYGKQHNIIHWRLKFARIQKGLSQENLAAKMQIMNVNMDQQSISRIERNARIVTDYELACFCSILGISPNDLLADLIEDE